MKRTYSLVVDGKNRDRLVEAAKHDIRKYIKRERGKAPPLGSDFWDFDCRSGATEASARAVHVAELIPAIDALVAADTPQIFVEVLAKPACRTARPTEGAGSLNLPALDANTAG